jgi:tRNA-2-methylthio-N6-dimethylallyladenosine synthase
VSKTFYIETFGCQMNAHDSEKVIGTLEQQGYARVEDEGEAGLILYNTCSIRDKAEQKVFHRLNEYKRLQGEGKKFAEFAGDAAAAGGWGAADYRAR